MVIYQVRRHMDEVSPIDNTIALIYETVNVLVNNVSHEVLQFLMVYATLIRVLEIDMSELESLFLRESREEEQAAARLIPPQIDRERAHNCTIMLSNVKISFKELMDHALALDDSALDADQLDNIIQFCPTNEEMDQLKDYKRRQG
ncbi:formin, FH2 domain-containing protein [Artemisia annua]|uniref:Formin, FH2 domain-containing protein n=1 Tax=Artemisia annua TaxID=35608 RepID=A0A2U1NIV5_ARTAN|nr:formin, FH2 domain-containing protein [Artemisia annua]